MLRTASAPLALRTQIRSADVAATGNERIHPRKLDHMEEVARLLARIEGREGYHVHRTWRQLSRGLGWAEKGMTVKEVHNRFKSQLHRTLGYLELIGWIDGWEPVWEGRECTGVIIRVPAGVAQLVRAAGYRRSLERRPSCSHRRPQPPSGVRVPVGDPGPDQPFFGRETGTPPKGLGGGNPLSLLGQREKRDGCARATASRRPDPVAALAARRETFGEEGGQAILAALPWLAGVAPAVLARAACRVSMSGFDLRLSVIWEQQLVRSVGQLDRLDGAGAGAAMILDLVGDGPKPDHLLEELFAYSVPGKPKRKDAAPRTLGSIAVAMKRWARRRSVAARRGYRGKTPPDPKALAAWREAARA